LTAGLKLSARYDVLGLLGAGASADVYRVRDLASGEERALKVLRDPGDAAGALAFRREFLLLLRLRHPSLVNVFEFETLPDGRPAFSAEIVEGEGLGTVFDRTKKRFEVFRTTKRDEPITVEAGFINAFGGLSVPGWPAGSLEADVFPQNRKEPALDA
jgi:serine/threonine protein kinase